MDWTKRLRVYAGEYLTDPAHRVVQGCRVRIFGKGCLAAVAVVAHSPDDYVFARHDSPGDLAVGDLAGDGGEVAVDEVVAVFAEDPATRAKQDTRPGDDAASFELLADEFEEA